MTDESRRSSNTSNLETLSIDSDGAEDVRPWDNLVRKLSVDKVKRLAAIFKDKEAKQQNGGLSKDQFVSHVDSLIGNYRYSLQSALLFEEIDGGDTGSITWEQFSDFVLGNVDSSSARSIELSISSIFTPPHVQKETVAKIVPIETEKYFCYAVLSKFGRVGLYDGNFNFLTSYYATMAREDLGRRESEKRRRNRWITDAVFFPDAAAALVVASSARTATVYDTSGLNHVPLFLVLGLPDAVHALDYDSATNRLFMGDDGGELTCLKFWRARTELLRAKRSDGLSVYFWRELEAEKGHVSIERMGKIHKEAVRKIQYVRSNNLLVTCSRDEEASVVIKHLDGRLGSYTFRMNRGASCFELSKRLNVLATGSDDGVVRLWNPFSTAQPIGTFKSHKSGIADLRVLEEESCLITLARDGVLKLWSVERQQCLQTLRVAFPSFGILGKFVEWGTSSIYPGPKRSGPGTDATWKRSNILVTCCDFVANVRTTFYRVDCPFELHATLAPPPLQTSVLIPSTWNSSQMRDVPERTPDPTFDNLGEEMVTRRMEDLGFVLKRDVIEEEDRSDINFQIATLETKKLQMKATVENYAPYSALELKEIRDIRLGPDLPVPAGKRAQKIVEKTRKMLEAANDRTSVLSRSSASRTSRSSRSSIVTFD